VTRGRRERREKELEGKKPGKRGREERERGPSEETRTYAKCARHHPLLPSLAVPHNELTDAAAERETLEELVEDDGDEERDPLRAARCT